VGLFILLRRIERWLHQHIFKVGWLITQSYQTTTILYYTFFLPGVILHEVIYWLAAGMLNVRAEHAIQWPEPQEVGELKLNFVQLSSRAGSHRKAIISMTPLLAGLVIIWVIANNIFQITAVIETMSGGELNAVATGFGQLTGTPDFWLWVYFIFTISNTMFPTIPKDLRGWRSILGGGVAIALVLAVIGLGGEIFSALQSPLSNVINVLQITFLLLMGIDVLMVLALGTIEYAIERFTGRSATFRRGKMITMTREEAIEERQKERERQRRRAERARRRAAADSGPTSIYALSLPVPGAPGDVATTEFETGDSPQTIQDREEDLAARISIPTRETSGPTTDEHDEDKPIRPDDTEAAKQKFARTAQRSDVKRESPDVRAENEATEQDVDNKQAAISASDLSSAAAASPRFRREIRTESEQIPPRTRKVPDKSTETPVTKDRHPPTSPRRSRFSEPSEAARQPGAATGSQDGTAASKSSDTQTTKITKPEDSRFTISPFRSQTPSGNDTSTRTKPGTSSQPSRFSRSSQSQARDEEKATSKSSTVGGTHPKQLVDEADDKDDDDESILRRQRAAANGVSDLFDRFRSSSDDKTESEEGDVASKRLDQLRNSLNTPTRSSCGSSRPAPKPRFGGEGNKEGEASDEEIVYEDLEGYDHIDNDNDEADIDYDDE